MVRCSVVGAAAGAGLGLRAHDGESIMRGNLSAVPLRWWYILCGREAPLRAWSSSGLPLLPRRRITTSGARSRNEANEVGCGSYGGPCLEYSLARSLTTELCRPIPSDVRNHLPIMPKSGRRFGNDLDCRNWFVGYWSGALERGCWAEPVVSLLKTDLRYKSRLEVCTRQRNYSGGLGRIDSAQQRSPRAG